MLKADRVRETMAGDSVPKLVFVVNWVISGNGAGGWPDDDEEDEEDDDEDDDDAADEAADEAFPVTTQSASSSAVMLQSSSISNSAASAHCSRASSDLRSASLVSLNGAEAGKIVEYCL